MHDSSFFEQERLDNFLKEGELGDARQVFFLYPTNIDIRSSFHFPEDNASVNYFALVDMKGMVRGFYDVRAEADQKLMVEHLAILLPIVKKRKTFKVNEEQ